MREEGGEAPSGERETAGKRRREGPIRRLYDWMLHWAETPHGTPALVALTAAESSFFPIPPDPLLMALCLGAPRKSLRFAAWATLASVVGGVVGYAIGAGAWHLTADFFYTWVPGVDPEAFESVQAYYGRWDFWVVFIAGFTFIPYKLITISAGVFGIYFPVFLVGSTVSRGLRFFAEAALIYFYGPPIQRFIDRYFDLLAVLFAVLLVGGFVLVKVLF